MRRIMVSVQVGPDGLPVDVEVPAEMRCDVLAARLAMALDRQPPSHAAEKHYVIAVLPVGKTLAGTTTLAEAGVEDGAALLVDSPIAGVAFESQQFRMYTAPGNRFWLGRRTASEPSGPDALPLVDLGREADANTVSRRHALIEHRNGTWYLRVARDARNPVAINGRAIGGDTEAALHIGDEIHLGAVRLHFVRIA